MDTETAAQKNPSSENKNDNETTYMSSVLDDADLLSNWVDFIISVFDPIMEKLPDQPSNHDFDFSKEYLSLKEGTRIPLNMNGRKIIVIGDDDDDDENENGSFNNDDEIDVPKNIDNNNNNNSIDVGNFADFATFDSGVSSNNSNDSVNISFDPFALISNPLDVDAYNNNQN